MVDDESPPRPRLDVAIAGEGVAPDEVPLRELAALLSAVAALLEAVGRERGESVTAAVAAVTKESAGYAIVATDPAEDVTFEDLALRTLAVAKDRGKGGSPEVRHALLRVHQAGARGAIRLGVRPVSPDLEPAQFIMAAPIEVATHGVTGSTVLYGRVVGVEVRKGGAVVKFRPEGGARIELAADDALAERAGRLFNRTASAAARAVWATREDPADWELLDLRPWEPDDLLDILGEVQSELAERGIAVNAGEWLAAAREGDDT